MNFLALNLLMNLLVFGIAAKVYVLPRLARLDARAILTPILLLHATRHLGMMFLSPGATYAGIPAEFAHPAAYGDLIASLLALITLYLLTRRSAATTALLWVFSIEGSVDLIAAITLATIHDAGAFMGPAYWIPAIWVPALLVTHWIVFLILVRRERPQPAN